MSAAFVDSQTLRQNAHLTTCIFLETAPVNEPAFRIQILCIFGGLWLRTRENQTFIQFGRKSIQIWISFEMVAIDEIMIAVVAQNVNYSLSVHLSLMMLLLHGWHLHRLLALLLYLSDPLECLQSFKCRFFNTFLVFIAPINQYRGWNFVFAGREIHS